ncbi:helix-turn-helix domain-containing protein [Parasphingorhabdus sp.]|uniref:helix-turn-helix domain-containing protein n=1 Tax=Parasphingorhabdus sp. TaxID=2709688 RepID=UPI003D27BF2C
MKIQRRLGKNVKKYREAKGWSQEQFAFEAEIHRTYISDIERGSRNPTIKIVEKLAKCLEISSARLLE